METGSSSCGRCGGEAAAMVGDEILCGECFHEAGSCCGTFGGKDEAEPVEFAKNQENLTKNA